MITRWVWTDEPSEGWCGDHATRESAIEEARLATKESFHVAEVEDFHDDEEPLVFLRLEEIAAMPNGSEAPK